MGLCKYLEWGLLEGVYRAIQGLGFRGHRTESVLITGLNTHLQPLLGLMLITPVSISGVISPVISSY